MTLVSICRSYVMTAVLFSSTVLADVTSVQNNLSKLHLPDGFTIEVYAEVPKARQMTLDPSTGTVYVGTFGQQVYAIYDNDHNHQADGVKPVLDGLKLSNGVAVYQDRLYVAEQNQIAYYPLSSIADNDSTSSTQHVIYNQLPDKFHHGWRYLAVGPDNKLYVTVGSPCNICKVSGIEGTIIRMDPDGKNAEIFARGIRNSVGMAFQPATGNLFFTDNNTDMMGDDIPPGELNVASEKGLDFGFPFYAGGHVQHPRWQDRQPPQKVTFPIIEFQAHSANLGLKFYTGTSFPKLYQGDAFIAQHGSWNRSTPVGYQIMRVKFDNKQQVVGTEVFIEGWLNQGIAWGRPTDILQLSDGSILISDDYNGVIYRVSYSKN